MEQGEPDDGNGDAPGPAWNHGNERIGDQRGRQRGGDENRDGVAKTLTNPELKPIRQKLVAPPNGSGGVGRRRFEVSARRFVERALACAGER